MGNNQSYWLVSNPCPACVAYSRRNSQYGRFTTWRLLQLLMCTAAVTLWFVMFSRCYISVKIRQWRIHIICMFIKITGDYWMLWKSRINLAPCKITVTYPFIFKVGIHPQLIGIHLDGYGEVERSSTCELHRHDLWRHQQVSVSHIQQVVINKR